MLVAGVAGALLTSEDVSATPQYGITGDETSVATSGTLTFDISLYEPSSFSSLAITYTAKVVNSSGVTQSSAVSPSSGSLTNGVKQTLTITAPSTAGTYTLSVTFSETIDEGTAQTFTSTQTFKVLSPITLSVTVKNTGNVDLTDVAVYFYIDDVKISASETELSVDAGSSTTITYKYANADLSSGKHTFKVLADEGSYITIEGLGTEQTFYYHQGNYDYMNYIMVILFILMIALLVYVLSKPVKNYGKPKARR